ncbi:MAG TPA: GNAT family protein, partial [Polyangia bacterium]|nr:GNAT family protein [Polyangia bacterium]
MDSSPALLYPLTLDGERVRMEPLALAHVDGLVAAASESRDTFGLTQVPHGRDAMAAYVDEALADAARGAAVPFATVDKARGRVVGSTRFGNIERWKWPGPPVPPVPRGPDAVEIGWTWLAPSAQRSHVNTEAKLLMMAHAFDVWGIRRLTLKTDERNARSRANIERVGCRFDGVLRAHGPAWDGGVRNTAFYSMLASEWPAARDRLAAR